MDLEYNQRNYRDKFGEINNEEFLEIPVLVNVSVIGNNPRLYLFAGPNFGIHDPVDIGILGGIGFSTALSKHIDLFLQAGYVYGLNDLSKWAGVDIVPGAQPFTFYYNYSREIRFQFGFLFGK